MCVKLLEIIKHYRIYRTFHSMKKKFFFFFLGRTLDATMGGTLSFGLECFLTIMVPLVILWSLCSLDWTVTT